jgi:hypothetical protein
MRIVGNSGVLLLRAATGALRFGLTSLTGDARAARSRAAAREAVPTPASSTAAALIYELLDAHYDTAELAEDLSDHDERWQAHLDYLRALQRTGREVLARIPAERDLPRRARRTLGDRR